MTYHRMGQLLSLLCWLWGEYQTACARADRARRVRVFGLIDIINSRLLRACEGRETMRGLDKDKLTVARERLLSAATLIDDALEEKVPRKAHSDLDGASFDAHWAAHAIAEAMDALWEHYHEDELS